jgi:hypothetical protein
VTGAPQRLKWSFVVFVLLRPQQMAWRALLISFSMHFETVAATKNIRTEQFVGETKRGANRVSLYATRQVSLGLTATNIDCHFSADFAVSLVDSLAVT